jgi:hypothetical protein
VLLIGFIVSTLYKGLIAWWADPLAEKSADRRLAEEIRNSMPFLFSDHDGEVVRNPDKIPRSFDLAIATVRVDEFALQFVTVRGEYKVYVASHAVPHVFREVGGVLDSLDYQAGKKRSPGVPYSYSNWLNAADILQNNWERLTKALT